VKLLLDSHTLLWYALGDPQLSGLAKGLILDPANEIHISPATLWEIAIKVSIGKLALHEPYQSFVDSCLRRYGFLLLPIKPRHTAYLATLPFPRGHKDPFDRMLISQSSVEAMPLLSDDVALDAYGIHRMW